MTDATISRSPIVHALKTWPDFFDAVQRGDKPFEVRKADRDFRVGDVLALQRWDPDSGDYTRDESGSPVQVSARVTYVLPGGQFGIKPSYIVMGLRLIDA